MSNKVNEQSVDPEIREVARRAYKAYVANADNKSWDGRECPSWEKLTPAVRSHWCAAMIEVGRAIGDMIGKEALERVDAMRSDLDDARAQLVELQRVQPLLESVAKMSDAERARFVATNTSAMMPFDTSESIAVGPDADCDCGHPVSVHHGDCHWNPPHSHRSCACKGVTITGVQRDQTFERALAR